MELLTPSFPVRVWLAGSCFVRLLIDGEFAREVKLLRDRGPVPSGPIVEFATMASGVLTCTPVVPTPASAPTPAEVAAEAAAVGC
jgi:hypothetical protein